MKKNINNIIFISILVCAWVIVFIFLILNRNEYNFIDNRKSHKLEKFNFNSYLKGNYQDNIEIAIGDQMPLYNYFKLIYPKMRNYTNYNFIKLFKVDRMGKYAKLGNDIYLYNDYLLYKSISEFDLSNLNDDIQYINYLNNSTDSNIYLYYINSDANISFEDNNVLDVTGYLKNNLNRENINISSLEINSFDEYKRYFYRLDHHLNYSGTDMVYRDLNSLMMLNNSFDIKDTICFNNKRFLGSKSKSVALDDTLKEKICINQYDLPGFKITIDGAETEDYGSDIDTIKSSKDISYALIYGSDYSEIIFVNNEISNNKNLLIYSNSYSNSLNKLLAAHYNKTYVIDGRYNRDFDMKEYINKNNIDDVLILANKMLFFDDIRWGDF